MRTCRLGTQGLEVGAIGLGCMGMSDFYGPRDEGEAMLAGVKKKLDAAGIRYNASILVGPIAETIAAHAKKTRCDLIFIGTHGRSATGKLLLGSIANKVTQISPVPVLLVR